MPKKILAAALFLLYVSWALSGQKAAFGQADESIKAFLSDFKAAVDKMDTYRCIIATDYWKGDRHTEGLMRFQFKHPNLIRVDIIEGRRKGSAVVLNKRGKIRGKNSWGFRRTLKFGDRRVRSVRGTPFIRASLLDKVMRLRVHILERGCRAVLNEEKYTGRVSYHLRIEHRDPYDPVTKEDIWIEKGTYIPLADLKYEGDKKVADTRWQEFEVNIVLEDRLFEL